MCRAAVDGGRRCPCTNGDRRRAYQRVRYAARKAAAAAPPDQPAAPVGQTVTCALGSGEQRRAATTASINEALATLRDPARGDHPEVQQAYLSAVLDHGAVIRDSAGEKIARLYVEHRLDDASVSAEAARFTQQLERIEAQWAEAKAETDRYLTTNGSTFLSDEAATAHDQALNSYIADKNDLYRQASQRSDEINERRAALAREVYLAELAGERNFGGVKFEPSNTAKMTKKDRGLFAASTAYYPDEMVAHAESLGPMLAKRSKARAHYSAAAPQRARRTRAEVFDLHDALQHGRFRFNHYMDSPGEVARNGLFRRAESAFLPRTPDNERRVGELVDRYNNDGRRKSATIEYAPNPEGAGQMIYVKGPRKRVTTEVTHLSAELTYGAEPSTMVHEMAHRIEDRNREISVATKAFLRRRTDGLPSERYAKGERVIPDGFADRYMGKDYPKTHHTELLSCGMEAVTHGRFGGLVGRQSVFLPGPDGLSLSQPPKADPEHLALVLGLLAAANKRIDH